jgi:type IV secretion system protein VirB10
MTITRNRSTLDPRVQMTEAEISAAALSVVPEVARQSGSGDNLGLFAGLAGALLLGGITFWSLSSGREEAVAPAPAPVPVFEAAPAPVPMPVAEAAPQPEPVMEPTPEPVAAADPNAGLERLRAPALVVDASTPPIDTAAAAKDSQGNRGLTADERFAERIGASEAQATKATRMANPGSVVPQGAMIPGVLETALNSDLPGFARALVTQDVRSFDGARVLVPRGSRVIGQYRGGLAVGQTRAYVIWTRLLRPDGVSVALSSPGTDDLGQTGLTGDVDAHFFKRFGSAVLLSVVGGLSTLGDSTAVVIGAAGAQNASSAALQRDANIPPTVKVRQGEPIRIFVARDLDFSTVETGVAP